MAATAIINVRVFDGDKICDPSTVIIEGEAIGSSDVIPTKTIDARGAILLPGLIDCHVHLTGPDDLTRMTEFGITTALDMGTWPIQLLESLRNQKGVTDIRACGIPATAPGSVHSHIPSLPREALVANAIDAERFVADRIAEAADYIKIVADVPGPDQETLNALTKEAHRNEKLVIAHAVTLIATHMAQLAGADIITHTAVDGTLSDQDIQDMVENKRISIPTLTMMKGVARSKNQKFETACKNVAALHLAGVSVFAGTDANKAAGVPSQVDHGVSLHEELELLVSCGMSTTEVLRAATSLPARYFGLHDRGVIKPGYRADLVLVRENPIDDIKATRLIERTWVAGQEFVRSEA
ncbi:uncharacterized protein N7511_007083 [Penicillium nucicola]|uniref:uncharacterized protein n=1 Tax=Penicillium nucicola TaxID=1850975 RepID=UPI002545BDBB|nr:uncharacterized protein N7511_007083 [Penicillium nucicola]KAJ5756901.1 hypothetical protein N7511_007083 [Penicillium nucicola]